MSVDNSTYTLKTSLRIKTLVHVPQPIVLEAYGGWGKLFLSCYYGLQGGVVFEKNPAKADYLARQRPTWAVYEADCVQAIAGGAEGHLPVNFLDLDPYGEPWPALNAFWKSERPWPELLAIVVNDGLRSDNSPG